MIKVSGLVKRHPGAAAPTLAGVSFEVPQGALCAVLGESGSGKTTLLRLLAGLDAPDAGAIEIAGGRPGFVPQSYELFPHLTVLDNCTLAPRHAQKLPRAAAEAKARALLADLGLAGREGAFPEQLSGGQKQRVAIARALCLEPRALLYDEPTSALDPSLKQEVAKAMKRVRERGVTQLVVTHDHALAREVADLVIEIRDGRVAPA